MFDQLAREKHYYVRLRAHSKMARSCQILFYVRSPPGLEFTVKTEANCIEFPALEGWDMRVFEIFIANIILTFFPELIQVLVGELNLR